MQDPIAEMIMANAFPRVLLLFGDEELLVEESARLLFDHLSALDATQMNCDVLDGETTSLDAVMGLARSFPVMADRRVVWVKRAEKMSAPKAKKAVDSLRAAIVDAPTSTLLLLTAALPSIKKTTKKTGLKFPFDVVLEHHAVIDYPRMKEAQIVQWLRKRAGASGISLEQGCAELIVAQIGPQLRDNAMELDKLINYLGNRTTATVDDVHSAVGTSREFNVFELEQAIGAGNTPRAVNIAARMIDSGTHPLAMVSMLNRYFTGLFRLIDLGNTDPATAARTTGLQQWKMHEYHSTIQRFGPRAIENALIQLRTAESTMKSSSTAPDILMLQLLASVMPTVSH